MHIPIVIGSASRYEIVGDPLGRTIAENFYDFVVGNRSYATGNTSSPSYFLFDSRSLGGHNGGNGSFEATDEHWGEPGLLSLTLTNNNQVLFFHPIPLFADPIHSGILYYLQYT
jgi:hypothetical protein